MRALSSMSKKWLSPLPIGTNQHMHLSLDRDGERFVVELWSTVAWDPSVKSIPAGVVDTFVARICERKRIDNPGGVAKWLFAATDVTVAVIDAVWPKEQLTFADEETKTVFDYLKLTVAAQERTLQLVAKHRHGQTEAGAVDADIAAWEGEGGPAVAVEEEPIYDDLMIVERDDMPLAGYQRIATNGTRRSEGYGLFMEQGTGKSAVAVTTVCNEARELKAKRMYRVLVVCPKNVRSNWVDEFRKFSTLPHKSTVLRGGQVKRVKQMLDAFAGDGEAEFTAIICSYECMVRMIETMCAVPWDRVILDESHFIKWPTTKRSQAAMRLRESARRRTCLTGTPILNSPLDIYSQLEFLGRGWSGFMSWKNFRTFYGCYRKGEDGRDILVAMQNLPFMKERLARLSFIIRKEEALPDLPDKVYDIVEVSMTSEQQSVYEALRTTLIAEIKGSLNASGGERAVVINHILTKLLRLAQITSGFVGIQAEIDDVTGDVLTPKSIKRFTPNPKLDMLFELLRDKGPNSKTIVWATWVPDIEAIVERAKDEGIDAVAYYGSTSEADREEAVRRFNYDRDCKLFIGNPAAGGTGVNLLGYPPHLADEYETNCDHEIYYSQNWSLAARSQSEDRAHRRGTRGASLRITDLCVPGTIDETIRARVVEKRITAYEISDLRDIVKAILEGVIDDE